jgi:hypothetical protein
MLSYGACYNAPVKSTNRKETKGWREGRNRRPLSFHLALPLMATMTAVSCLSYLLTAYELPSFCFENIFDLGRSSKINYDSGQEWAIILSKTSSSAPALQRTRQCRTS